MENYQKFLIKLQMNIIIPELMIVELVHGHQNKASL